MSKQHVYGGHPEHGQEYKEEIENEDDVKPEEELDDDGNPIAAAPPVKPAKTAAEYEAELATIRAEMAGIRAAIGNNQKQEPKKEEPEPEPDWENMLFQNPKEAVQKIKDQVTKTVTAQLTKEYQADQGKKDFWNAFYHDHEDLKEDDDLVKMTMNKHLNSLLDLPVKEAGDKLADLTREHIMKYTGGKPRPTSEKKATVEGSGSPSPTPVKKSDDDKVVTLSDLIRARRQKRLGKSSAA